MDINPNIQSQFQSTLEMLRLAVVQCPDEMWNDPTYRNVFWQVVYHALFYTHLYLQPRGEDFVPWEKHRPEYHQMQPGRDPYTKQKFWNILNSSASRSTCWCPPPIWRPLRALAGCRSTVWKPICTISVTCSSTPASCRSD